MGRQRKDNPLNLPPRVYAKHGRFWYVRNGQWVDLGTDLAYAIRDGQRRNLGLCYGQMRWWWAEWHASLRLRAKQPKFKKGISPRTLRDYEEHGEFLLPFFGDMQVTAIRPHHVAEYLEINLEESRPIRANKERDGLSAFFSWLVTKRESGVNVNPCFGVKRNPTTKRLRFVTDEEFQAVFAAAHPSVKQMMMMVYRTLQRPSDVKSWTRRNVVRDSDGNRHLTFTQSKTRTPMRLAINGAFAELIDECLGVEVALGPGMPLIRTESGQEYTLDGISSMLRKTQASLGVTSFGFGDLKGKGATDMLASGVALEQIQALCGHESIATTEIYIKQHSVSVAQPNLRKITG